MKKLTFPALLLGLIFIVACGPSAEEKAADEKRIQDSIAEVQRLAEETLLMEQQRIQDSLTMVMEQMRQDSIAMAVELAKTKKGSAKPKAKPDEVKPVEAPKSVKEGLKSGSKGTTDTSGSEGSVKESIKNPK